MSRDHHLPGGRKPIHTIQAVPTALAAMGSALDELARQLEQNEQGVPWTTLREVRARLEQYAASSRSISAKVEDALFLMAREGARVIQVDAMGAKHGLGRVPIKLDSYRGCSIEVYRVGLSDGHQAIAVLPGGWELQTTRHDGRDSASDAWLEAAELINRAIDGGR